MTLKKRVYIAGPISKGDLVHNVRQSDEAFIALVRAGFAPFNPMWSVFAGSVSRSGEVVCARGSAASDLGLSHAEWLGCDLPWVAVAHAVLRLPGESTGADMECAHAVVHGVPVFHSVGDLARHFAARVNIAG